jgi:hypothetical protein
MGDDDEFKVKPNPANLDDEFFRHPHSGAFIRNPFLESSDKPIKFPSMEFEHNCLDDALQGAEYHCIRVTESSFKNMTSGANFGEVTLEAPDAIPKKGAATGTGSPLSRAALSRLAALPTGYEFTVTLKKSSFVEKSKSRRRNAEAKAGSGTVVDKLNIEVSDAGGKALRIDAVNEGLVTQWNKNNPVFTVRPGDTIVKVNYAKRTSPSMLEELMTTTDLVRMSVCRTCNDQQAISEFERQTSN